jgi:hypothetical protein
MTRVAAGVFLLLHAVITAAIWIPPQRGGEMHGWGWQASWLFADSRPTMVTLGVLASAAIGAAGLGVLGDHDWWAGAALVGAIASFALIAATFTPWWSAAVLINLVVVYLAWSSTTTEVTGR